MDISRRTTIELRGMRVRGGRGIGQGNGGAAVRVSRAGGGTAGQDHAGGGQGAGDTGRPGGAGISDGAPRIL